MLPTAHRALAPPETRRVDGYGIDAFLLLTAARTGTVTSVHVEAPKRHAASFPPEGHLRPGGAGPARHDRGPVRPTAHPRPQPVYWVAPRPVDLDRLRTMVTALDDFAPYEPRYDAHPWLLSLVDAWHAVRTGTAPPAAAQMMWPHYVHRVRTWLIARPGAKELAAAHTRLSAALSFPARSRTL